MQNVGFLMAWLIFIYRVVKLSSPNINNVLLFYRVVKLSSPNINNVLLLGCILTYSTVFMKTIGISTPQLCMVCTILISSFHVQTVRTSRIRLLILMSRVLRKPVFTYAKTNKAYLLHGFSCWLAAKAASLY